MYNAIIINLGSEHYSARSPGAHLIATHLREEGWDIEVIDYGLRWSVDQLKELAKSRVNADTKFIGFSHQFVVWTPILEQWCQWLKATYPNIILIGGSAVIPNYHTAIIDYHIHGYGEYAVSELLKYLFSNGSPVKFALTATGAKRVIPANDFYPAFPKRSLLAEYQDRDFIEEHEWLSTETSRGCVFSCDFCNFPILGVKGDYTRSAEDFEREMRHNYDKFGVKNYIIADETFNDRTDKIAKYADVVERLDFQPSYTGFLRADLLVARPKDREELLRMNCIGHYYGVESFNRASAKAVGKGMDSVRLQEGLVDIKNYFQNNGRKLYRGTISLIVGLPEETAETIEKTKQWLIANWQNQAFFAWSLEIAPNSDFGRDYKKYGYEVMTPEDIGDKRFDTYPYNQNPNRGGTQELGTDYLTWKNKDMNIFDSILGAVSLQNLTKEYPFALDCWQLSSPGLTGTLEERMMATKPSMEVFHAKVKRYIENKLSL